MFQFVYWLRAIAAVLITNAHYADIWPISALAVGGHLGNCIYFFLSGFCLYNIREHFLKWYAKRMIRIYPALWIAAAVNFLVGFFSAGGIMAYIHCFLYPTWYHFISSIMLLYIVFYILRKIQEKSSVDTRWFLLISFIVFLLAYILKFDKSYYHIDDVAENWCRFQFMASMLVGALVREKYNEISKKITKADVFCFAVLFVLYFAGKKLLSSVSALSMVQILMPLIQVFFVASIGMLFVKMEKNGVFARANTVIQKLVELLAGISLEIYLVQYVIIAHFAELKFPINFIVVTGLILVYAWCVHRVAGYMQKGVEKLLNRGEKVRRPDL